MALASYSNSLGVVAADFDRAWQSVIDTASNGHEQVGFTHLSDKGLPVELHIPTHRKPEVRKARAGGAVGFVGFTFNNDYIKPTTADFLDMSEDYMVLQKHFKDKGADEDASHNMAGFAAVNRNHLVRHGLVNTECKTSVVTEAPTSSAEFTQHCQNLGVTDEMRGKLLSFAGVPASVLAMAFEFAGVNNYSSNHSTTGRTLPSGQLKVYAALLGINVAQGGSERSSDLTLATLITDMAYTIFHPCSKTLSYYWSFGNKYAGMVECCTVVSKHWVGSDSFMELRKPKLPAGTAALGLVQRTLRPLADSGLILVIPSSSVVTSLKVDLGMVISDPFAYHPGARYLEVSPRSLSVDAYKDFLADAGYFVKQMNILRTVLRSPVMQAAMQTGGNTAWYKFVDSVVASTDLSDPKAVMAKIKLAGGGEFVKVDLDNVHDSHYALMEAKDVATMALDATGAQVAAREAEMRESHRQAPTADLATIPSLGEEVEEG